MTPSAPPEIAFRPLAATDFPMLTAWLAEPHVRRFYQKTPVTLDDVARKYGPRVRGEEPTISHLALHDGVTFAYLQCYRNADYPEWVAILGESLGISIDFYIGDPAYLRRGLGRAALNGYLRRVAFPHYAREHRAFIGHDPANTAALRCSGAAGFQPVRRFWEDEIEMVLLGAER